MSDTDPFVADTVFWTEFPLDDGMQAAYAALMNRRVLLLDEQRWSEFMTVLDAPLANNPGLRALLARKPTWEL